MPFYKSPSNKICVSQFWAFRKFGWALAMLAWGCMPELAWADVYDQAMAYYQKGQYTKAAPLLLQAVAENQTNAAARYYLADVYVKLNRLQEAETEFHRALDLAPGSQVARLSKIALEQLQHRKADAAQKPLATEWTHWKPEQMPLKLYVQPGGSKSQVIEAMNAWCELLQGALSYVQVSEPDLADIRVLWVEQLEPGLQAAGETWGVTSPKVSNGALEAFEIRLQTINREGALVSETQIYRTARHELGHALGLPHSEQAGDVMAPVMTAQNAQFSPRDIQALQQLYSKLSSVGDKNQNQPWQQLEAIPEKGKREWMALSYAYAQHAKDVEPADAWYRKAVWAINQALIWSPNDPDIFQNRSILYQQLGQSHLALADINRAIALDDKNPEYYRFKALYAIQLHQVAVARSALDIYLREKPTEAGSVQVQQILAEIERGSDLY